MRRFVAAFVSLGAVSFGIACGSSNTDLNRKNGGSASSTGGSGTDGSGTGGTGNGSTFDPGAGGQPGSADGGSSCATVSASAALQQVTLAFAFDVSGSMGKGDYAWHDRTLKWDPVVAASKAFFEDSASAGIRASMTFFPDAGGESARCLDSSYVTPDVPITVLPSNAFGTALDTIGSQAWRGGTPTLHVMRGVISFVQQQMNASPGKYAIVLVTDGYPQDCSDNRIASVVDVVSMVAATIPTYVIGVANPPIDGAPDTVSDLGQIAVAGGTEDAFIVDTGNPTQTAADFNTVVSAIAGASVSCTLPIPIPTDNRQFDREKVAVHYASGSVTTDLAYDAACGTNNAWHYNDLANPTEIVLCPTTCNSVQADPAASLDVEFTCQPVITIPR